MKYKHQIDLPKGFIVKIEGLPFELLGSVKVGSNTLPQGPETHKYWCDGCDEPFLIEGSIVKVCPECGSKKFGLDEPIKSNYGI